MSVLGIITAGICALVAWLFIVPSTQCPNKKYRRLFWVLFITFFLVASVLATIMDIHDKWYVQGAAILVCSIIASQISIHIWPNKSYDMDIDELKYKLLHTLHHEKPAFALLLAQHYYNKDHEQAVKYASLAIEMIDSLDPSDLIGPYKAIIADQREFARQVYLNVINDTYKFDVEYQRALNTYRSAQSVEENRITNAAIEERKKIIGYFYK